MLGAGTSVAPMRRDGEDTETLDLSGEDRILALLAAAFSAPVKAALLVKPDLNSKTGSALVRY